MKIKKTPTKNEYIRAGDIYVRNFAKKNVTPICISNMFVESDFKPVVANEEHNRRYPSITDEKIHFTKVAIISDGYGFAAKQKLIASLPKDVAILAVNGALRNWTSFKERTINAYVINNPYAEATRFLPSQYYPTCLISPRTNAEFCKKYKGDIYKYSPTPEQRFGQKHLGEYYIDDYRNPICACIGLAYQFGVEKLMLLCCDDSFEDKRDYAVQLKNGLWAYPQQMQSHEVIDANLYWLTHQEDRKVKAVDLSSGGDYVNAMYISEEETLAFFNKEEGT